MSQQEKFNRLLQKYPQERPAFFERPHWTRRRFFQLAGGVTGSSSPSGLAPRPRVRALAPSLRTRRKT